MSSETSAAPRDEFMICAPNPMEQGDCRRLFFLPLREPSAADVQGDWRRATPPSDTWLHDMVRDVEAAHAVPSSDPAIRHSILARDRFGDDWPAISRTLGWHYYRLYADVRELYARVISEVLRALNIPHWRRSRCVQQYKRRIRKLDGDDEFVAGGIIIASTL